MHKIWRREKFIAVPKMEHLQYNNKEVIRMCFSYDQIEHQAYRLAKQIMLQSKHNPVRLNLVGNSSIELTNRNFVIDKLQNQDGSVPLIKHVILQDQAGKLYSIEPCETGLQFAQGEITYKEYLQKQKGETKKLIGFSLAFITLFLASGWGLVTFL